MKLRKLTLYIISLIYLLSISACSLKNVNSTESAYETYISATTLNATSTELDDPATETADFVYRDSAYYIPPYAGKLVVELNDNEPLFAELTEDFTAFAEYSELDDLGRVGVAEAILGPETLPKGRRQSIRNVKPSGWHQNFYSFIEQQALYTRSHLIAFQLSGENANVQNLMTGTHMFNTIGMVPYEEMVGNFIRETKMHVQYRVTPYFGYFDLAEDNLLADGVQIEARSVEDHGKAISFNVFVYNVESGVDLDYKTGYNQINELGRQMGYSIPKKGNKK